MPHDPEPGSGTPDATVHRRSTYLLWAALIGGGLLRLWFYIQWLGDPLHRHHVVDAQWYLESADRIAAGQIFGPQAFYFGPLYSYAIAPLRFLGISPDLIVGLQHLLGLLTCYLVYRLGARVFGPLAGAIAALLFAFSPPVLYYESFLLMETLLAFLVSAASLLILRGFEQRSARHFIFAGILLGLAATGRPGFVILPLVAGAFIWRRVVFRSAATLWLAAALIIAIPILHNSIHEKRLTPPTTSFGFNLYAGNGPEANGASTDMSFLGKELDDGGRRYAEGVVGHALSLQESSEFWRDLALDFMGDDPARVWTLTVRRAHFLWANLELPQIEWLEGDQRRYSSLGLAFTRFALLSSLALIGLIWGRRRAGASILALFVLAIPVMYLPFFVTSRFRVAWIPLLCVFAGFGILFWVRALRNGPLRLRLLTSLVLVASIALSLTELVTVDRRHLESVYQLRQAERALSIGETTVATDYAREAIRIDERSYRPYFLLGSLSNQAKEWEQAERAFAQGMLRSPGNGEGLYGLAIALHRSGRSEEALVKIEEALESFPREAHIVEYSGMILDALGRSGEAEARLRLAIELIEDRPSAHLNYGTYLARHGRTEEAVLSLRRALDLDGDSVLARRNLALALLQLDRREEALRIAEPLPEDDPLRSYLR